MSTPGAKNKEGPGLEELKSPLASLALEVTLQTASSHHLRSSSSLRSLLLLSQGQVRAIIFLNTETEGEHFPKGGLVYFWALIQDWISCEKKSCPYIPAKQNKVLEPLKPHKEGMFTINCWNSVCPSAFFTTSSTKGNVWTKYCNRTESWCEGRRGVSVHL